MTTQIPTLAWYGGSLAAVLGPRTEMRREGQFLVCITARTAGKDSGSTRKALVDVRVVAGVRLGVVQLAGVDLQMTQITSRMGRAQATETSEVARRRAAMGTIVVLAKGHY